MAPQGGWGRKAGQRQQRQDQAREASSWHKGIMEGLQALRGQTAGTSLLPGHRESASPITGMYPASHEPTVVSEAWFGGSGKADTQKQKLGLPGDTK